MCFERRLVLIAAIFAVSCFAANLTYSTYLRSGFQPAAIASDAQGNLYLSGQVVTDPASGATTAAVAKPDARASQYLYFVYLDGAVIEMPTFCQVNLAQTDDPERDMILSQSPSRSQPDRVDRPVDICLFGGNQRCPIWSTAYPIGNWQS